MTVDSQSPTPGVAVKPQKPEPKEGYVYKYLKKTNEWKPYKKPVTKLPAPEVA